MVDEPMELDLAEGTLAYVPRRQHYFDDQYAVFFSRRFEEVMRHLTGRDYRVLIVMLRFCSFGNDIHVSRSVLARSTGIAENHISSITRKLERLEIITVVERGIGYRLNERYFWRGTAENHAERRQETRAAALQQQRTGEIRDGGTTLATDDDDGGGTAIGEDGDHPSPALRGIGERELDD